MQYKIPLVFAPQIDGGYTVTSPLLPELLTEGETVDEALANVRDALAAVIEIYEDLGRKLPQNAMGTDADARWDELLASDEGQLALDKLADEALAEIRAGNAKPMICRS